MSTTTANHHSFRFSALLRSVFPRNTAKLTARASGATVRSAENWLADRCSPSAETLVAMAQADDRLRAELISILTKGLPTHVSSLEEEPSVVDRRRGSMDGNDVGPSRGSGPPRR